MAQHSRDHKPDNSERRRGKSQENNLNTGSQQAAVFGPQLELTPQVVMQLQRTVGNQAVSRLVNPNHDLQRVPGRPRLSTPSVRSATARGAYVRLDFGMQWTRDEAVDYLWPGGEQPAVNFFMPDASDPMASEENGYQWFLILPNSAVLAGIRPEVHRMIYQSIPQSEGGVELSGMIPQDIQQQIQSQLSGEGDMTLSGAWPSADEPAGLYWVRRSGRRTEVQAAQLPSLDDAPNERHRRARQTVNHDIAHFVVEDHISITEAKARVRRIHAGILRMILVGYLEAIMIFGGANPTVGGRFAHDFVSDGEE